MLSVDVGQFAAMARPSRLGGDGGGLCNSWPDRPGYDARLPPKGIHVPRSEKRQPRTKMLGLHHSYVVLGTVRHTRDCGLEVPVQTCFSSSLHPRPNATTRNETGQLRPGRGGRDVCLRILRSHHVLLSSVPLLTSQLRRSSRAPPSLDLKLCPKGNLPNRPCPTSGPLQTAISGLPISGEEFTSIQSICVSV